eukprot:762836-Hanusia_phi.AAC.8
MRLCKECLYKNTIERYYLETKYRINLDVYENLPHTRFDMYMKNYALSGYMTLHHYWKPTIENRIGKTFAEIDEELRQEEEERLAEINRINEEKKQKQREKENRKIEYYETWHNIFQQHIEHVQSLQQLLTNEKFKSLYSRRIKHTNNVVKIHKIYRSLM